MSEWVPAWHQQSGNAKRSGEGALGKNCCSYVEKNQQWWELLKVASPAVISALRGHGDGILLLRSCCTKQKQRSSGGRLHRLGNVTRRAEQERKNVGQGLISAPLTFGLNSLLVGGVGSRDCAVTVRHVRTSLDFTG